MCLDYVKFTPGFDTFMSKEYRDMVEHGPFGKKTTVSQMGSFKEILEEHPMCAGCAMTLFIRLAISAFPNPEDTITARPSPKGSTSAYCPASRSPASRKTPCWPRSASSPWFHREVARRQKKPRWAMKTAFDAFHWDRIEQLCGDDAYFLCIQRHGLDVACSIEELCRTNGAYLSELHEYVKRHPRPLEAFCHAWVDITRATQAFVARHPENALLVRYEDLTADPDTVMRRIADFVRVDWPADTDLDGTLLDHCTYAFASAEPALRLLHEQHIPLVVCSRKTRSEIEVVRDALGNADPFFSENGGAVFIPAGYFHQEFSSSRKIPGYEVFEFGTPYARLLEVVEKIRAISGSGQRV